MKTIQIRFSDAYREGLQIKSINFTDIVNSEEFEQAKDIEGTEFTIELY